MSKTCKKCGIEKSFSEFNQRWDAADGFYTVCKACRQLQQQDQRQKLGRRVQMSVYGKHYRQTRVSNRVLDPVKNKCRITLRNAVHSGTVAKPMTCQECGGGGQIQAHHHDYSKPFDVRWLCTNCHGKAHRKYRRDTLLATVKGDL